MNEGYNKKTRNEQYGGKGVNAKILNCPFKSY